MSFVQHNLLCAVVFSVLQFVHTYMHNSRATALLSEMPIFYVRAACEIQFDSYGFKNALQSLVLVVNY